MANFGRGTIDGMRLKIIHNRKIMDWDDNVICGHLYRYPRNFHDFRP